MPIVQVASAGSRSDYESVASRLNMAEDRPAGLILHAASETDTGEIQIVDVWESAEAARAFEQSRLFPLFQEVGLMDDVMTRGEPAKHEPFDFVH